MVQVIENLKSSVRHVVVAALSEYPRLDQTLCRKGQEVGGQFAVRDQFTDHAPSQAVVRLPLPPTRPALDDADQSLTNGRRLESQCQELPGGSLTTLVVE